eukprot:CAMPEP_0181347724 /NCGR_PEP_ID=MMETSP1101-20121128/34030_1 /TAXON_ID=46948 /ORGANISM="Rhodomonas abbreviata, Strain Caron Lab Isolate" /LENGTH=70 /DNA_ID=CAMNT_0023459955 /DNA_START=528 /DNA_END=737 /DNA_ORIENTATION=-
MSSSELATGEHTYCTACGALSSTVLGAVSNGHPSASHLGNPPSKIDTFGCPIALNMYHARGQLNAPLPSY